MAEVHYRVLVYRRGGALGDRLVLGLVHWDGVSLRSSFDERRVGASGLSGDDSAVRGAVRAFRQLASECAPADEGQGTMLSLEEAFRVPSGVGSALEWSAVKFAEPSRPEDHFEGLCQMHRLAKGDAAEQDRITGQQLREGLRKLGERLREEYGYGPEQLKVGEEAAGGLLSYTPPLSWKNGAWHHAVPVSFDTSADEMMTRRAFTASGHLVQGIARDDCPVVILAMPDSADDARAARRCRAALEAARSDVAVIEVGRADGDGFAEIERRIVADVGARR